MAMINVYSCVNNGSLSPAQPIAIVVYYLCFPPTQFTNAERDNVRTHAAAGCDHGFEHPLCPLNILCENPTSTEAQEVASARKDTGLAGAPQRAMKET